MTNPNASETTEHPTRDDPEAAAGCCGGPAPTGSGACCVRDAKVKEAGGPGCGCSSTPAGPPTKSCC